MIQHSSQTSVHSFFYSANAQYVYNLKQSRCFTSQKQHYSGQFQRYSVNQVLQQHKKGILQFGCMHSWVLTQICDTVSHCVLVKETQYLGNSQFQSTCVFLIRNEMSGSVQYMRQFRQIFRFTGTLFRSLLA